MTNELTSWGRLPSSEANGRSVSQEIVQNIRGEFCDLKNSHLNIKLQKCGI
jgi:hypothetical protein